MDNCKYEFVIPSNHFFNVDKPLCGAYGESKRKDGRHWAHYPECCDENCPLAHPELLEDAILEMEE